MSHRKTAKAKPARHEGGRGWALGPALRGLDWNLVAMILAVKLLLLLYGAQAFLVSQNAALPGEHGLLEIWNRWDAPHYLDLARDGYTATGEQRNWLVFYPLYPWAVRLVGFVTGDLIVGAFFVSAVASVAAGLLLQRLALLDEGDERRAQSAVWFLFIFPTSYFLHIGYTESLFLALALGSFLSARTGRWWLAGCLGALAAATRVNGALLAPALAAEAFLQYRQERRWRVGWLWIALVGVGLGVYLLVNYHVAGDPLAFQHIAKEKWYKTLAPPWDGLREAWRSVWSRSYSEGQMVGVQEVFFILLGFVCAVWCWLRSRASYAVWVTLNWLLWTSTKFVLSVPRYTLILFPLYFLFARLAGSRPLWNAALTVWSLLFLALFAARFVQGLWAF